MGLLRRTPPVVREVPLEPGERRVAWALDDAGAAVVATDRALVLPDATRLPWTQVERATWQRPRLQVRALPAAPPLVEGAGAVHDVVLADEHDLPEVVRARVTGGVAFTQRVTLGGDARARLVARRVGPDALEWQVVFAPGVAVDDPVVQERARLALEQAKRTLG